MTLHATSDGFGRGKVLHQLGIVAYERFRDARAAERLEDDLLQHLNAALKHYMHSLELTPAQALDDRPTMARFWAVRKTGV